MDERTQRLIGEFERQVARPPQSAAFAPGRVNLIGEHTDYCEGLVLPCAIDLGTTALVARRADGRLRGLAPDLAAAPDGEAAVALDSGLRPPGWIAYAWGVARAISERGLAIEGFDLLVSSTLPLESGLSSSAALCVAITTALDDRFDLQLSAVERARIAHRAESHFVGVGCGILDPFASALGQPGHAVRIDCRSEEVRPVPLPADRMALLVADSGVRRKLASGDEGPSEYRQRVDACREALEGARRAGVGAGAALQALRDLGPADLPALRTALGPLIFRRARHVISENARVEAVCDALERGDLDAVGRNMKACQASLRDDYEVSVPELDALCEAADRLPGVYGSRLTGAGFGGCTLHLVDPGHVDAVSDALAADFADRLGRRPPVYRMSPAAGARVLSL